MPEQRSTDPQLPTIRRDVNYYPSGSLIARAAKIVATQAEDPDITDKMTVHLFVMMPTTTFHEPNVPFAQRPTQGHWCWPSF